MRLNARVQEGAKREATLAQAEQLEKRAITVMQQTQDRIEAANRAQAQQRRQAQAVGASSEAIKQKEQRGVEATRGKTLGTIGEAPLTSSEQIDKDPSNTKKLRDFNDLSAREKAELITSGQFDNFFIGQPDEAITEQFILSERQQNKTKKEFEPFDLFDKQQNKIATIKEQSKGALFDFFLHDKDKEEYISNLLETSKTAEVDTSSLFPFPLEANPKQKSSGDPLGLIKVSNQILQGSEKIAIESKKTLDSDAPVIGFNSKGTKAKAFIEGTEAAIIKNIVGITGLINIGAGLAAKERGASHETINIDLGLGKSYNVEIPIVERVQVQPTLASTVLEKASKNQESIPGVVTNIPSVIKPSIDEFGERYGAPGFVGEGLNLAADVYLLKGLSPVKLGPKFVVPLEGGLSKTIRPLVTYGGREILAKVGSTVARTSEKAVLKSGILDKVDLPKIVSSFIEKKGRGAENEFLGATGSKIFSGDRVLNTLKNAGKLNEDDVSLIKSSETLVQESKKIPDKLFRDDYSVQPFENIPEELTKTQLAFFREKGIVMEGSAIDIPTFLPQFAGKAGDFDAHVINYLKARAFSQENTKRLNLELSKHEFVTLAGKKVKSSDITFVNKGGKVNLYKIKTTRPTTIYPKIKLKSDEVIHGTSKKAQHDILSGGVDISASQRGNAFFTTSSINLGKHFAKRASGNNAGQALLKLRVEPSLTLKWKNVPKEIKNQLKHFERIKQSARFQPIIIQYARSKGFKAVEKPYNLNAALPKKEIIIFDEGAIKSVEPIPLGKTQVPVLGKKMGKAGEFLSEDDPESLGQISKSGKVFGVDTPTRTIKIGGNKQKVFEFQLHRRAAEISSFQLKEGKVSVGPSINKPGQGSIRVKDFPRLYAAGKTSAFITLTERRAPLSSSLLGKRFFGEEAKIAKSLKIEAAANEIKRIGEKEINFEQFFRERRLTESYAQQPSNIDKLSNSINNISGNPNTIKNVYSETLFKNNRSQPKESFPPDTDRSSSISISPSRLTKSDIDKGSQLSNIDSSNLNRLSNSISRTSAPLTNSRAPVALSRFRRPVSNVRSPQVKKSPPSKPIGISAPSSSPITGYPRKGGPPPGSPVSGVSLSSSPVRSILRFPKKYRFAGLLFREQLKKKSRRTPSILTKRLFIADPADPQRAGVIAAKGVEQLVSKNIKVFKKIDVQLGKARNKANAIRPFGI